MKRVLLPFICCASVLLAACDSVPKDAGAETPPAARKRPSPSHLLTIQDEAGVAPLQKVEFRAGSSSATVERMAKGSGCESRQGAGLVTKKGPIEVYRMQCENGRVFLARCELRQCRPMR